MKILSIETSCDETGIALVEAKSGIKNPDFKILKNLVASQIEIHRPFGGIVPSLAKREHIRNLPILLNQLIKANSSKSKKSKIKYQKFLETIDLIAVTIGPGLEPCLWQGINFAKELAKKWNKPLVGVNHLKGHLYSFLLLSKTKKPKFPAIALLVSGGHTILFLMKDIIHFEKLGETRDDAAGEAFDKTARLLGLNYPGGPEIEKIAKHGNPYSIDFPRPMLKQKNYDFSFSGLKTAVYRYVAANSDAKIKHNVAASFQQAVFDVLISKTLKAAKEFKAKSIILSGGVASNNSLRKQFLQRIKKENSSKLPRRTSLRGRPRRTSLQSRHVPCFKFYVPSPRFCTDNATIIAIAGYFNYLSGKSDL